QHGKHMFHFGSHFGLGPVLLPFHLVDAILVAITLVGKVLGVRRVFAQDLALPAIGLIAPYPRLLAVQQVRQHRGIGGSRRRRHHGMNQLGLAVHSHVGFHPEVPLLALACLVHLRIPLLPRVLGRTRSVDNRRIYDGPGTEAQSLRLQMLADPLKQPLPQLVLLQQMTELAHRGLVRHRFSPQIDAHKLPHPRRIVQRFFHSGVGQVEPLLQKVNPQHPLRPHRRPPIPHLGIHRFDQRTQLRPRHHLLHLLQKQRPSRLLRVALKPVCHRQRLLFHLLLVLRHPLYLQHQWISENLFRVSLACPVFLPASQGPLPLERSSRVLPCPSFPTGQSRLLSLRISNCTTTTFREICAPNDELHWTQADPDWGQSSRLFQAYGVIVGLPPANRDVWGVLDGIAQLENRPLMKDERGSFRDTSFYAISAILFGSIKCHVRLIQERFHIGGLGMLSRSDAHTHRGTDCSFGGRDLCGGDQLSNVFRPTNGGRQVTARQNHQELFATIATHSVVDPEIGFESIGYFL